MILKWRLLAKVLLAIVLGNVDALMSHITVKSVPIWFIDLYAVPIEYTVVSGVLTTLTKLYKRVKNARQNLL